MVDEDDGETFWYQIVRCNDLVCMAHCTQSDGAASECR